MARARNSPRLRLGAFLTLCALVLIPARTSHAASLQQSTVEFSTTTFENHFPTALIFHVHVTVPTQIVEARLYYTFRNEASLYRNDLEIEPASEQDLSYTLSTADTDAVPSTPIFYYWQVTLDTGETVRSEQQLFHYDDIRFRWQVSDTGNLAVWWHDRTDSLGQRAAEIAQRALDRQAELFNTTLDFPIRVLIYNNQEEFAAWHRTPTDLIGGQAFPGFGITAQIVENAYWENEWLNNVLPHEISHLYFYQVTYNPLSDPPSWLNEGVAQYNEFGNHEYALREVRQDILAGKYIPLRALQGGFGYDEEKFGRSYDESLSVVKYLVDTYGEQGLSDLLDAYKEGKSTTEAFSAALGLTLEEFEYDWLASLGASADLYPTATAPTPGPIWPALTQRAAARQTPSPTPRLPPIRTTAYPAWLLDAPAPGFAFPGNPVVGSCLLLICAGGLAIVASVLLRLARKPRAKRPRAKR